MRLEAKGRWIDEAIDSMLQPSRRAAEIMRDHGAIACTDITGFGLAGHLVEMLEASGVAASLDLNSLPALAGATASFEAGVRSTLDPENRKVWDRAANGSPPTGHPAFSLLFDPQTSGGLLAGVPTSSAEACLAALREAGYSSAARIGTVEESPLDGAILSAA